MIIEIFGSGCINDPDNGITVVISDCDDPDNVSFEFQRRPEGAPDPMVVPVGNGQYMMSSPVEGAFIFEATCNG